MFKPANAGSDLSVLRAEIAKWQERVPKITEILRRRSEALAGAEQQNRELRKALAEEISRAAESTTELRLRASQSEATVAEMESELRTLQLDSSRFQKEISSLESRNRMLSETVDILTYQFSRANEELLALRRARDRVLAELVPPSMPESSTHGETTANDLLRIRGIGTKTRQLLFEAGITTVESLAAISAERLDDPGSALFPHRARIRRECWVQQARELLNATAPTENSPL
jgi:predicted flap endonuclease-1-like 5' DNA nuclease